MTGERREPLRTNPTAPTQAYLPGIPPTATPGHTVELVTGSRASLSSEIARLLRARLGLVAICLAGATAAIMITGSLFWVFGASAASASTLSVDIVAITGLSGLVVLIYSRAKLSLSQLRYIESCLFGIASLNIAIVAYLVLDRNAVAGNTPGVVSALMTVVVLPMGMMFLYVLMIPSTLLRAAVMVGTMAWLPVLLILVARFQYEAVQGVLGLRNIALILTELAVGAGGALFCSHTIGTLRKEAFEARRFGQYQLKECLGTGGMGEVYLAEHLLLKRPCAIKVIQPSRATDTTALARFEREVRAAAELTHPNTIAIFDYGRADDGSFYYVMEYLPGLTLSEMVERHGPMPPERVIHLLRQVCGALGEAHGRGLVHRDIKPSNIIVTERGGVFDFVKLLDFGLVKPVTDNASAGKLTRENMVAGSPLFMSPEQSLGNSELDGRSDLYSLGAVAYCLLTARPPFPREIVMEILVAHARDAVTPPSRLNSQVPPDLENVVLRCLAKNRDDRFQTAEELTQALAGCESAGRWTQEHATRSWHARSEARRPSVLVPQTRGRSLELENPI